MKAKVSRRQLLSAVGASVALSALPRQALAAQDDHPLIIPKLIDVPEGNLIYLQARATQQALQGQNVEVWGFNGQYLGGNIRLKNGKSAKFQWLNKLQQPLSVSIMGLQAQGIMNSSLGHQMSHNASWLPRVPVAQGACTCLYRAATQGHSGYQTYRGLAGLCFIEDDNTPDILPKTYGVDDIPLLLQDVQFNDQGDVLFSQAVPFLGNTLLVNGVQNPFITVGAGLVRLRLANGSVSRRYPLRFADQRYFMLIGQDQGYFSQGIWTQQIYLAPGERAEILVDLSAGGRVQLLCDENPAWWQRLLNSFRQDVLQNNVVVELRATGLGSAFTNLEKLSLPNDTQKISAEPVAQERNIHLDCKTYHLNQQLFDPRRVDITAAQHSVERWHLTSDKPTGFCVQGAKFVIEKINGKTVPQSQRVWKDTLWLNAPTDILITFPHTSSNQYPFTFGASDLNLADKGCQGLLIVS